MMGGRRLSRHEQRQLDDIEQHLSADLDLADAFTVAEDQGDTTVRAALIGFGVLFAVLGLLVDSPMLVFIAMAGSVAAAVVPGPRTPSPDDAPRRPDPLTPAT